MKIPFYILGLLLQHGPQHGYSLNQMIEERIADFAKIKLPTIYYHLDKLKQKGCLSEILEKDGNRPDKVVYSITESGREYFSELFNKQLKESYSPEFAIDGVLYFKEKVDNTKFQEELYSKKQEIIGRLTTLNRRKASTLSTIPEQFRLSAEAIFDHHLCHLEAELAWLERTIKGLVK